MPAAPALTGMVEPDGGGYRQYYVAACRKNFTLFKLFGAFNAHQTEWQGMGRADPWYSVDTTVRRGAKISEEKKADFYMSGRAHVENDVEKALQKHEARFVPKRLRRRLESITSVLDFGCGLGRLAFGFARAWPGMRHVACVDQSESHLQVAEREWALRKGNASGVEMSFVRSTPDLLGALGGRRFALVHTVLVLQHMAPPLQIAYLEQLCDALELNGRGYAQIPTGDAACPLFGKHRVGSMGWFLRAAYDPCDLEHSIRDGGMQMHYTPARDALAALARRGCRAEAVDRGSVYTGGGRSCHSAVITFRRSARRVSARVHSS